MLQIPSPVLLPVRWLPKQSDGCRAVRVACFRPIGTGRDAGTHLATVAGR